MIVVTGASGRTGGAMARALLEKGEKPRVVGRDAKKLHPLVQSGAEASVGNLEDSEFLARAFVGASAVYLVLPEETSRNDFRAHQECVSDSFAAAVPNAHVPYVVSLRRVDGRHR